MNCSTTCFIIKVIAIIGSDMAIAAASANPVESARPRVENVALFALLNLVVNSAEAYEKEYRFASISNRGVRVLATTGLLMPTAVIAGSSWDYFANNEGNPVVLAPIAIAVILMFVKWAAYASWSPEREENPV